MTRPVRADGLAVRRIREVLPLPVGLGGISRCCPGHFYNRLYLSYLMGLTS